MELYDSDAEQIVLGSILQNPDIFSDISRIIKVEDFYFESSKIIYQSISDLFDLQQSPDVMLIISHLKNKNLLDKVGNRSALMQIAATGSQISAPAHANKVKELALRRELLQNIKEIERSLLSGGNDLSEILNLTEKGISAIFDRQSAYSVNHIRDVKEEFLEFLKKLKESKNGITGLATNFKKLDLLTTGFKGGQLIVLAARPGMGKTTFALNIASNVALKSQQPVLIFSMEMNRLELLLRLICADTFIDSAKIQRGFINEKEIHKITESLTRINSTDTYIDDSADMTAWDFRQRSRRLAKQLKTQKKKLGLIIVDYLQLMTDKSRASDSRQMEVANISRSLKLISKELDVPVLALSQMNRSIEQRGKDPRPQLSDLRESGAIEQDADMVMFIHREDIGNPTAENAGQAEIIIGKHRAGPTGNFKLAFIKEKNIFMDLEFREDEGTAPSANSYE